jgi:hypothetical protein
VDNQNIAGVLDRLKPYIPAKAGPECKDAPHHAHAVSTFLRTYHYTQGEFSAPHYDRSLVEHENTGGRGGKIV